MSKKNKGKKNQLVAAVPASSKKEQGKKEPLLIYYSLVVGITAVCFLPMLQNEFTNWDDTFYVTTNSLLHGPDWAGIFTQPVQANYHPLTIITLAFNYAISGLNPVSYFVVNLLLHLTNTALVFYFIRLISDNKNRVAFFTALIFGIHPMHVESVAWISERKDVLYSFFFLLSLIQYWRYLQMDNKRYYWFSFCLFILSLLSKPAAIVLPLVLLLLDYWKGKALSIKSVSEKIPFFIASVVFAILTLKVQTTAIADTELYPLWLRPIFACYTLMIYFFRFIIPYPLSAFHPYPSVDDPGVAILASPVFVIILAVLVFYYRKNKSFVFGILFFIINLLLVLQFISIGQTIVSERYTYMPYIGLAFAAGMWLDKRLKENYLQWMVAGIAAIAFGYLSNQRTKVWSNSETLWTDAIRHYPKTAEPRANRASYSSKKASEMADKNAAKELFLQALEDCNIALETRPRNPIIWEKREFINLNLGRNEDAIADATKLISLQPGNQLAYYIRGLAYSNLNQPEKAFQNFDSSVIVNPGYNDGWNNRGAMLLNYYQRYNEALADFNKAISLDPMGKYFLNRSICYLRLGDYANANADAQMALQKGTQVPDNLKTALGMK